MTITKINNRRDFLLLLLYSPGKSNTTNEAIVGRTRLVKLLFLFKQEALPHFKRGTEVTEENFYEFFPWDFGPFSTEVYDDLTFFILRGFIESSGAEEEPIPESAAEWEEWLNRSGAGRNSEEVSAYEEEAFSLTEKGLKFTQQMYDLLSASQRQLMRDFKARLADAPLRAILKYVYSTYPETTQRSVIKGEVIGHSR